ncbi:MAG TPA: HAD family phosphatase [Tepidisphaeraceae bacterium]|jgi:HAD superfamily hydrolase (TIGR01509 family)
MRAVIFDMDGLMIDSEKVYWEAGRQIAREFGKVVSDETLGRMMGRKPLESIALFAQTLGITEPPENLLRLREARVLGVLEQGIDLMPGLDLTLKTLHKSHPLAIATSAPKYIVDVVMAKLQLRHYFQVIQTSDDVTNGKPDPEIYLKAMSKLDVLPSNSIVLEDSSNGALAGKRSGAYTIAVPSTYTRDQDFSFVDYIAQNLTDATQHIQSLP